MLLVVDGNRADEKSVVITRGNGSWPFSSNAVECYVILNGKLINQKCNNPSKRASKFRFDMVVNLSSALLWVCASVLSNVLHIVLLCTVCIRVYPVFELFELNLWITMHILLLLLLLLSDTLYTYNPRREAGGAWCLPPVWNLGAVIWFHFTVSCSLPSPVTLPVLSFLLPAGPFCWTFPENSSIFFVNR